MRSRDFRSRMLMAKIVDQVSFWEFVSMVHSTICIIDYFSSSVQTRASRRLPSKHSQYSHLWVLWLFYRKVNHDTSGILVPISMITIIDSTFIYADAIFINPISSFTKTHLLFPSIQFLFKKALGLSEQCDDGKMTYPAETPPSLQVCLQHDNVPRAPQQRPTL